VIGLLALVIVLGATPAAVLVVFACGPRRDRLRGQGQGDSEGED
jgi:hypothetical protein